MDAKMSTEYLIYYTSTFDKIRGDALDDSREDAIRYRYSRTDCALQITSVKSFKFFSQVIRDKTKNAHFSRDF